MLRSAALWVVCGVGLGATAVLGVGCRSADPPIPFHTAHYPGLQSPAAAPPNTAVAAAPQPTKVVAASATEEHSPPVDENAIDLGVALRLAGVDNPTVGLARERVREALAGHLAARALLLPSVNVGGNFYLHRGTLQASSGLLRQVDRQTAYLGAVGTNNVAVPGVWLFAHLGDAVYAPLAARQRVAATRSDAAAVRNAVLGDVAAAYLQLVGAEARLGILRRGEADVAEVVRLTRVYAEKGQGREADAGRAVANAELLRRQLREAEEDVGVASARLCRLLNLDPSVRLRTPVGAAVQPLCLIPEEADVEPLIAEAVRARPELFARSAEIQEAQTRVRQERVRPFAPLVSVGFSGGAFGGGSDQTVSEFGPLKGRTNLDVVAVWNVESLGFGNRARVRRADATVGLAVAEYDLALNQVRREVAESLAGARAAARQIASGRAALAAAEEGFTLEVERIRQGLGRPIETLDSFRQLLDARQEVVRATVAYDVAQFRLFVAVGSDPLAGP